MGSWGGPLTADRSGLCPLCSWRCKATGTAASQEQPCQPAPAQHRAGRAEGKSGEARGRGEKRWRAGWRVQAARGGGQGSRSRGWMKYGRKVLTSELRPA